jgi:hypothetical protein
VPRKISITKAAEFAPDHWLPECGFRATKKNSGVKISFLEGIIIKFRHYYGNVSIRKPHDHKLQQLLKINFLVY